MNKIVATGLIGLTTLALLSGCQKEDTETKKQLAQLQAQLEAEKAEKAQREAKEREQKQKEEQLAREEQIRQEAEESVKARLQMEAEEKAAKQKEIQQTQPSQPQKITEKVVRYPATVVTQSGYGDLSLRGEASTKGVEISKAYDGDEVTVIARTSKCEVIGKIEGCWVKVQLKDSNVKGYMFDGYLNREVLSQEEKAKLQGNNQSDEAY